MSDSKTIAALEVGTGKMQVFLGEIVNGKTTNFVGSGQAASDGVKKADIIDLYKAATCAQSAIAAAEGSTGAQISSLCLGISGTHIKGFRSVGSANVAGADGVVRRADVERAKTDAKSKALAEGRTYIHKICCGFHLDGKYCSDPLGKKAERIDAEYWLVHGDTAKLSDAIHIVQSFGVKVEYMLFSGIASALAVTDERQRNSGVLVADIGCGTCDYAYLNYGRIFKTGVVPVGGDHITNDLSFGLQLSRKNSEKIKTKYARAVADPGEEDAEVWTLGDGQIGDRKISTGAVNTVVGARLEELFLILKEEVGEFLAENKIGELVLTGGTSNLDGICELASSVLGIPCAKGKFGDSVHPDLRYQEYATALGLLEYAKNEKIKAAKKRGVLGFLRELFKF